MHGTVVGSEGHLGATEPIPLLAFLGSSFCEVSMPVSGTFGWSLITST